MAVKDRATCLASTRLSGSTGLGMSSVTATCHPPQGSSSISHLNSQVCKGFASTSYRQVGVYGTTFLRECTCVSVCGAVLFSSVKSHSGPPKAPESAVLGAWPS